jgi:3-methyladenine DNA glycosylase AlkD
MTTASILEQLAAMGSEQTRKTFKNHGAPDSMFGVKVGDLKTIVKKVKKNHELSLELYATGNSDAQYLAGLIADEKRITAADLQHWAEGATWYMLSEYTVPWVAAESPHGWQLALQWIESDQEKIAECGWATLNNWVSLRPDETLDIPALSQLLDRVSDNIHPAQNRVRYVMNGFVIATGCYVAPLHEKAKAVAQQIGKVSVNVGNTACKVPFAPDYIQKVEEMGRVGVKRKMARC